MANKLLLMEDVEALGRSGDLVSVKPGYARNFLLPQGLAVIATKQTVRLQERLQEERRKKAVVDKKEAEELASSLNEVTLTKIVKVDNEGHMYGSVSANDIIALLKDVKGIALEKRNVQLPHPIKKTGVHKVSLKLNEGVPATINVEVLSQEQKDNAETAANKEAAAE